jgi:hypothetical protein
MKTKKESFYFKNISGFSLSSKINHGGHEEHWIELKVA